MSQDGDGIAEPAERCLAVSAGKARAAGFDRFRLFDGFGATILHAGHLNLGPRARIRFGEHCATPF